jgi:hypothetical protein
MEVPTSIGEDALMFEGENIRGGGVAAHQSYVAEDNRRALVREVIRRLRLATKVGFDNRGDQRKMAGTARHAELILEVSLPVASQRVKNS